METVRFNPRNLKVVNNKNEELSLDLSTYAICKKHEQYLTKIYYFGGLISQSQLEELVDRKGTTYKKDLIELDKNQVVKKYNHGKYNLIALTKKGQEFITRTKVQNLIKEPKNHSVRYNLLYIVDYFINKSSNEWQRYQTFIDYQEQLLKRTINMLLKKSVQKKLVEYACIPYENDNKRYTALDSLKNKLKFIVTQDPKQTYQDKLEYLFNVNMLINLRNKNIFIDNLQENNGFLTLEFIILDISKSTTNLKNKIKYLDLILFELNNYEVSEEKILIKSSITILTGDQEREIVLLNEKENIVRGFNSVRKELEKHTTTVTGTLNMRLNRHSVYYIESIYTKCFNTERFFATQSDTVTHSRQIQEHFILTSDRLINMTFKDEENLEINDKEIKEKKREKTPGEMILDLIGYEW